MVLNLLDGENVKILLKSDANNENDKKKKKKRRTIKQKGVRKRWVGTQEATEVTSTSISCSDKEKKYKGSKKKIIGKREQ